MSWKAKIIAMIIAVLLCFAGYGLIFRFNPDNLIYVIVFSIIPVLSILAFDSRSKAEEKYYKDKNNYWNI
ncbi:hypothetical protein [Paenibacillus motobuensis]|jgi:hypothetical protein|uniref:Uncharacterized protein n=1 Tax=Paenibacillus motobuensis TaxID=295324 RepID=A0ABN0Y710_9BACL